MARRVRMVEIFCRVRQDEASNKSIAIADGTMEIKSGREREMWTWIPRKLIADREETADGTILTIPEWLAQDRGLI